MLSSQETIIKRIKERVRRVFVNKYATMIVAASFAIIFWSIGIFNIDLENGSGKTLNSFVGSTYSISEKANDFTTKFSNAIKDIFGSIDLRGVSNTNEKE